jgi:hypothetical protein
MKATNQSKELNDAVGKSAPIKTLSLQVAITEPDLPKAVPVAFDLAKSAGRELNLDFSLPSDIGTEHYALPRLGCSSFSSLQRKWVVVHFPRGEAFPIFVVANGRTGSGCGRLGGENYCMTANELPPKTERHNHEQQCGITTRRSGCHRMAAVIESRGNWGYSQRRCCFTDRGCGPEITQIEPAV